MDQTFPSDSLLLDAMLSPMWGSLHSDAPGLPITIKVITSPDLADRARRVMILIQVRGHNRLWAGKRYWIEDQEVGVTFNVPESDLYMMNVEEALALHFKKVLGTFPKQVAPRLFEVDPRIGSIVHVDESQKETWRPSPLFDPPGGVRFPFPRPPGDFPLAERHRKHWCHCGKCGDTLLMGAMVTWGGAYLRWVCDKCVPANPFARLR